MKTPSLVRSIERDLDAGHAAVIQIVSTGQALMERRLAEIPTENWEDVQVDITPREYVLDYLAHSFPVQLYGPFKDPEGNLCSPPVYRDGPPVESQEAAARRDRLIEKPASLTPVPGALDQVTQCFGTDTAAEVPGRSRRVVRKGDRWPKTEPVRPTLPKPRPLWTTSYGSLSSPIVAFGFEFARVPLLPAYALMPGEHVVGPHAT